MSSRQLRDVLAPLLEERLRTLGYPTLFFSRMPNSTDRVLTPGDRRFDVASIEGGDDQGENFMQTNKLAVNGDETRREIGANDKAYLFTVLLYRDARFYTRDDVGDELEDLADVLMSIQSVGGTADWAAQGRSYDPDITSVSREMRQYGDYGVWWGTLVVGYTSYQTVEED